MRAASKLMAVLWVCGSLAGCGGATAVSLVETPVLPDVAFDVPEEGALLFGEVTLSGSASAREGVFKVELQVDGGDLVLASGKEAWHYPLDTRRLSSGPHTLTAWVTDRKGQTVSAVREVRVGNAAVMEASAVSLSAPEVDTWDRLSASATLTNVGPTRAELEKVAFRAHPEGAEGPQVEFRPVHGRTRLAPGESLAISAQHTFSPLLTMGAWQVALVWRDAATGEEHVGPASTVQVRREVHLGSAIHNGKLFNASEPEYEETFLAHFDGFTPEFELKWGQVQPQQGSYNFGTVDRLVDFAESHGKRVRGHVLAWHKSLPGWMTSRTWTREEAIALLEDYVATVMGRYKGRILEWDVINEAFLDDGSWRTGIWYDSIGADYLELAFRAAHAVDPGARLYYNDYNAERVNAKSNAIFEILKALAEKGVPVHGVGFQAHVSFNYYPTQQQLSENLARFHAAGFVTHISELDVKTASRPELSVQERLALQAEVYRGIAGACMAEPGCTGITTWGFTDKYTWLTSEEMPLPFDSAYQRKPAFDALEQALGR